EAEPLDLDQCRRTVSNVEDTLDDLTAPTPGLIRKLWHKSKRFFLLNTKLSRKLRHSKRQFVWESCQPPCPLLCPICGTPHKRQRGRRSLPEIANGFCACAPPRRMV